MSDQNNFTGVEITEQFAKDDIEKNKSMAGLAYFIFFLPLLTCPDSKFAKFHANQSLILIIVGIIGNIFSRLPIYGFFTIIKMLVSGIVGLVVFIYWILGLIDAFGGRAKQFPVGADIVIIK